MSIVMQWGGCVVIGNWRVDYEGFPDRMHGHGLIVVGWGVDWMRLPAGRESWLGLNIPVGLVSAREGVCEGLVLVERRALVGTGPRSINRDIATDPNRQQLLWEAVMWTRALCNILRTWRESLPFSFHRRRSPMRVPIREMWHRSQAKSASSQNLYYS